MTTYPNDSDVWLLLADDVRQEMGNKVSILGYFAGDDILIEGSTTILGSLAILFVIKNADGEMQFSAKITPPSGADIATIPPTLIKLEPHKPFVQIIKFLGYPVTLGTYKVDVSFDNNTYRRSFVVGHAPSSS